MWVNFNMFVASYIPKCDPAFCDVRQKQPINTKCQRSINQFDRSAHKMNLKFVQCLLLALCCGLALAKTVPKTDRKVLVYKLEDDATDDQQLVDAETFFANLRSQKEENDDTIALTIPETEQEEEEDTAEDTARQVAYPHIPTDIQPTDIPLTTILIHQRHQQRMRTIQKSLPLRSQRKTISQNQNQSQNQDIRTIPQDTILLVGRILLITPDHIHPDHILLIIIILLVGRILLVIPILPIIIIIPRTLSSTPSLSWWLVPSSSSSSQAQTNS